MRRSSIGVPNVAAWREEPLEDLCDLISRGTAPAYVEQSSVLAIGQRCVRPEGFDPQAARPHDRRARNVLKVRRGDVLLNSTGTGTIGRSCVFDCDGDFVADSHVTVLRADQSKVHPIWIDALLRSPWGQKYLEAKCFTGSTNQVELSRRELLSTAILVPSIEEQRRIAETLDAVDCEIGRVQELIDKLDSVRRAILQDELEAILRSSPSCALGELSPGGGEYGSNSPSVPYSAGLPRYIRITDIDDRGKLRPDSIVGHPAMGSGPYRLSDGDLLVARTGFTTGKALLYKARYGESVFAGYLVRFRLDQSKAIPSFVFLWMQGDRFSRWVNRSIREVGQRNISAAEYAMHVIPVPPVDIQRAVVDRIASVDRLSDTYRQEHSHLVELKRGLMDDLLTGRVRV